MNTEHLLPDNRAAFETALSEARDFLPALLPEVERVRGFKATTPAPAWLKPALVFEYGLGEIEAYFGSFADLLDEGITWRRILGTPASVEQALGWLGFAGVQLADQRPRRRMWHRYQVDLGEVPPIELPVLRDAEYLSGISSPARSVLVRGFHDYDYGALEWSEKRWGQSLWGDDSGVRVGGGSVKWSFGEALTGAIVAGDPQRVALGLDIEEGDDPGWIDVPWDAPGLSWEGIESVPLFKSFLIRRLPIHIGFFDGDDLIGIRRPISVLDVTDDHDVADPDNIVIEVEARTGFSDAEGRDCDSCSLVFMAGAAGRPGALWIDADDVVFADGVDAEDMTVGSVAADFTFRRTVREHATLTLEI